MSHRSDTPVVRDSHTNSVNYCSYIFFLSTRSLLGKRIMRKLLFLILFPILLCSCLEVYWVNPVSDIQNAVVDERLIGTWVGCVKISENGKTEAFPFYLHIGKMDGKWMKVISQFIHPGGSTEEETNTMYISKLDGRRFMNMRKFNPNVTLSNRYWIMEYEMKEKDTFLLRLTNPFFVDNAIRNQALSGAGPDVTVTSESAEIRKFIRNSPREQLFPIKLKSDGSEIEYCSFKRLNFKNLSPLIRAQRL